MSDFEVDGTSYRAERMATLTQFDVLCEMSPILKTAPEFVPLLPLFQRLREAVGPASGEAGEPTTEIVKPPIDPEDIARFVVPFADAITTLSQRQRHFVLETCLMHARRQEGSAWRPIWNINAHRAVYDQIALPEMLRIAGHVFVSNFARFFPAAPSKSAVA